MNHLSIPLISDMQEAMGSEWQYCTERNTEVFVYERYFQKDHVSWAEGSKILEEQYSEMYFKIYEDASSQIPCE
jgi:hypothetical protein